MPLPPSTLNSVSIPMLLDWWQQRKRLASTKGMQVMLPKGDDTYLQTYYRLMEVYSVVKAGGVQAQIEAVKAFAEHELTLLNQQLAQVEADSNLSEVEKAHDRQKIEQELRELEAANRWRLQALSAINPAEEAIVQQHLGNIERTLMQLQCA
ncbi:MAG: hypothetical protein WBB01_23555 [Phormidesmis sp.]